MVSDAGDQITDERRFTVLPVNEETVYCPVEGSLVDKRVAAYSNSRRCKILFTRIDCYDNYLYGRLVVQCVAEDVGDCVGAQGIHVSIRGSDEWLSLDEFV